ncbi:hybrid sensor histidine kinase/response regulator [Desulfosudis oleivorans]|uniref:Chemotaxis protein CheA n=1 Tax=Desulfosudis oleivorans (strain DSM 6200 / JCM 39069 / Hxd3) TaxID=96561 RepID=A8ZWJ2_DESOH|nr:hybrid sensor histidine kinase/response regulator [Desulfosudis oleivorans]ABW66800.1 CheA signal transduction histidine kinase [Desulfosudis oleivorans Hxd3]
MLIEDEESLQMYVEESLDHMANIENNLLAIEKGGDSADPEIVNEVFRAAHSIKGGAGLMGLNNIKELSHRVESVLGMIREKKITPDASIISIVLSAFDKLYEMVTHIRESETIDISEEVVSLTGLTTASLPAARKPDVTKMINILPPDGGPALFQISRLDLDKARKGGRDLYLIEWDLIQDIHEQERSLMEMMKSVSMSGDVLDITMKIEAVGTLEEGTPSRIPILMLYSSRIGDDILPSLFNVERHQVHRVTEAMMVPAEADKPTPVRPDAGMPETAQSFTTETTPAPEATMPDVADEDRPAALDTTDTVYADEDDGLTIDSLKGPHVKAALSQTSLRVDVKLLDNLMTLAGEMVLSRNQLIQSLTAQNAKTIASAAQRINMVTSELQDVIMRTRMQSIGTIFNKFPRLVRDMSQTLGKKVELTIEGTDVELDKTIIEAISEPLVHLVRNSVDHGIEPPGKRAQLGKSPIGRIHLAALHEAGQVSIEITDDGNGIDDQLIVATALRKGLIAERRVADMSRKEKTELILLPGFSTSDKVTDVSGRGVGMDVVKTNLEKLSGTMDIDSVPGKYTTISIKLPLTLAIIPSQIISVSTEKYAIPQVNLDELLRIPADQVKNRIEKVGDAPVVRLRGRLLPLVDLAEVLGIEKTYVHPENGLEYSERRQNVADRRSRQHLAETETEDAAPAPAKETRSQSGERIPASRRKAEDRRFHATSAVNIAVVFQGNTRYGLIVDRLLDSEEIVVKPLGRHFKQCQEYSGATIMGDGRVSLILDVAGVAQSARLKSLELSEKAQQRAAEEKAAATASDQTKASLLMFANGPDEQFAVSLSLVERIESINPTAIEHVGGKRIIQYRGGALPLFSLSEVAAVSPLPESGEIAVIVFSLGGKEIGLMVAPPVDAIEVPITIDSKALKQPGIIGSAIIHNHTTLLVDVFEAVKTVYPDWVAGGKAPGRPVAEGNKATLLFAEDSDFFRKQVRGFLEEDGYTVLEAANGQAAWELLDTTDQTVDLVITDIEMPVMDGFELTQKIKSDNRFRHLSVLALTSLAGEEDIVRGKQIGITDYHIKMDREKLLDTVKRQLAADAG